MSAAVIGWQIFIFFTIFISEGKRGWVAAFWVLWTLAQVYALPLSVIQFFTIYFGYKLAGPAEAKDDKPMAPEHAQSMERKTPVMPAIGNRVEKTSDSEESISPRNNHERFMRYINSEEFAALEKEYAIKAETTSKYEPPQSNAGLSALYEREEPQADSAYVTRHNFRKISWFYLQPGGDISIDKIFSTICDKDLSGFLNEKEAAQIFVQKQMLDRNLDLVRIEKKQFSREYTFSVTPPKYHKDKDCIFLKADFSNYLVPPAIKEMGEEKVREFQEYCESHKKEFEGKPDDIFWARVGLKFNVHITPERVNYYNSGTENVEKMSIDDLRNRINETISHLISLLEAGSQKDAVQKFRYAPSMKIAISKIQDEGAKNAVIDFFNLKSDLANALFELYKRRSGHNSYILPITLLKACGLEPCKGCC